MSEVELKEAAAKRLQLRRLIDTLIAIEITMRTVGLERVKLSSIILEDLVELGKGTSGTVLSCSMDGRAVAIKAYNNTLQADEEREAMVEALMPYAMEGALRPESVLVDDNESVIGVVMPIATCLLELFREMVLCIDSSGWMGPSSLSVLEVFLGSAKALAAMHQARFIHGDVKPGNMVVLSDGTIVLIDFGHCGAASRVDGLAWAGWGTPYYHAPEARRDPSGRHSHKVDVFSFGRLMTLAFESPTLPVLVEDVIQASFSSAPGCSLLSLIRACCSLDPSWRPEMSVVVAELERIKEAEERAINSAAAALQPPQNHIVAFLPSQLQLPTTSLALPIPIDPSAPLLSSSPPFLSPMSWGQPAAYPASVWGQQSPAFSPLAAFNLLQHPP